MKNSQQPAFPISLQEGLTNNSHVDSGLTKREMFAMAAMQGLCTSLDGTIQINDTIAEQISKEAVLIADKTLNSLS